MSDEIRQVFIRNDKGKVWGPLALSTVELLIDNGLVDGKLQVSEDGVRFADPGRYPHLRAAFPKELWGQTDPGETIPLGVAPVPVVVSGEGGKPLSPPVLQGPPAAGVPGPPVMRPAAPAAGPGVPMAGPGALRPGPGAVRAGPGATRPPAQRPPPPKVGPPTISPSAPTPAPAAAPAAPAAVAPAAPAAPKPQPLEISNPGDAPPASGDLARHSPIHLYYLAASGDFTGLLSFQLADRTVAVHFRKGNPEHVSSSHPEDSVPGFLLRTSAATAEQIGRAEVEKDKFGGELIPALFGLGILNPGSAFAQLAQHATTTLMKALIADKGSFTWELKELPPHKAMPLGNRWGILTEFMRKLPAPHVRAKLQDALDFPVMKSGGRVQLQDLRLSPQETRALGFIDGVRSLAQLSADLPQDAENFLRLAFVLRDLEMISFAGVKVQPREAKPQPEAPPAPAAPPPAAAAPKAPPTVAPAAAAAPAAPKPAPARPPPPTVTAASKPAAAPRPPPAVAPRPPEPAAPVDFDAELKELQARAAKLKEQNLFEILGLKQDADAAAAKVSYFKLAKTLHPDTVPSNAPPELAKLKADVFAAVGDAYRKLSDDKQRAEYIEELKAGGSGEQIDVQAILMAEELFQKGTILVKAKKFPEAVKMLDDAIKANGEEGEFYAWRAIAKFFASADRKTGFATAQPDITMSLKKNARCAQAYFFQGQMAKLLGDNANALKQFQKTVELQPTHVDAQREIRLLKK